jgi:hypothetical protein
LLGKPSPARAGCEQQPIVEQWREQLPMACGDMHYVSEFIDIRR